jgi:farnesyl diphosphate synthase
MSYLQGMVFKVEKHIHSILSNYSLVDSGRLIKAIDYSVFGGGKRLRPFLVMVTSEIFNVNEMAALNVAVAIEFIHTYSLIHDDLPCMDDDDYRRGKEACHIKFDEATALLAGDALQSLAFEILASPDTHSDPSIRCELIQNIAKAIGVNGMAGGQMLDIQSDSTMNSADELVRLHRMKTGELFAISCEAGAILAKAPRNLRLALRGYALALGQAFQIVDDIMDFQEEANDTKTTQTIKGNNYLSIMDRNKARKQAILLIEQAKSHLLVLGEKTEKLRELADNIIQK